MQTQLNYGYTTRTNEKKQSGFMAFENIPHNAPVHVDTDKFCWVGQANDFKHGYMIGNAQAGQDLVMFRARTNFFYCVDAEGYPIDDEGNQLDENGHRIDKKSNS